MSQSNAIKQRKRASWRAAGLCDECGKRKAVPKRRKCKLCHSRLLELSRKSYRRRYTSRQKISQCVKCGLPSELGRTRCTTCKSKINKQQNGYTKQRKIKREGTGWCTVCGKMPARKGRLKCVRCVAKEVERHRRWAIRVRDEVLVRYGNRCKCCGETTKEFLQMDHVHNDGAQHRRDDPGAWRIYSWLRRNGFPDGFQILCSNCNWAKSRYGECPHQKATRRS